MKKLVLTFVLSILVALKAQAVEVSVGTQSTVGLNSLAIAQGFLDEELKKVGASLKLANFDSGADINAAFAAKSIDIGYLGIAPFVIGHINGLDTLYFRLDFINYDNEALVARAGKFKSVKDIKGAKIAVPFGTSAHFALLQILKLNNISPKDVQIIDIPAGQIPAAWDRGDVDVAIVWELILSALKNKDFLYSDKNLADNGIILADGIAVRKEFADKNPKVIQAYKTALQRAYEYNLKEPKAAAQALAKFFNISQDLASFQLSPRSLKLISNEDLQSSKLFGTKENKGEIYKSFYAVANFLKEQKILRKIPDESAFKDFILY